MRDALDRYYTPDKLANRLVWCLDVPPPRTILEPSIGGGAFARSLIKRWPDAQITGVDVDDQAAGLGLVPLEYREIGDYPTLNLGRFDLIVGNPPYNAAESHVRAALSALEPGGTAAFLLPLAFLASRSRYQLFSVRLPTIVTVLSERPSFTDDGATDSRDYAWITWGPRGSYYGPPALTWLAPEPRPPRTGGQTKAPKTLERPGAGVEPSRNEDRP